MSAPTVSLALPQHLPALSRGLVALALAFARWEDRRLTRRALARLDDHMLNDIGLCAISAQSEAQKPFWRD